MGVQGAAAPIFDYNKRVIGAVSFTALKSDNSLTEENLGLLKEYAKKISQSIGG